MNWTERQRDRHPRGMTDSAIIVVWVYASILVMGGLMGLLMAGSRVSFVVASCCTIPLGLAALGYIPWYVAPIEMGLLAVFFGFRAKRSGKLVPGVPMALASVLALGAFLGLQSAGT
jgi:uncharacterized membrane protein (UPF0136 family)